MPYTLKQQALVAVEVVRGRQDQPASQVLLEQLARRAQQVRRVAAVVQPELRGRQELPAPQAAELALRVPQGLQEEPALPAQQERQVLPVQVVAGQAMQYILKEYPPEPLPLPYLPILPGRLESSTIPKHR